MCVVSGSGPIAAVARLSPERAAVKEKTDGKTESFRTAAELLATSWGVPWRPDAGA